MFENYDEVMNQLRDFGLLVDHLQTDTNRPVRCAVDINLCPVSVGKHKTAGWYHLASFYAGSKTYLFGAFGFWKGADNNKQKIVLDKADAFTSEQRKAQQKRWAEMEKKAKAARAEEVEAASKRAIWIWSKYSKEGNSDYLTRKGVKAHGVRFGKRDTIAVPMMDFRGKVYGLQLIRSDEQLRGSKKIQKKFEPKGLAMRGHFHLIGGTPSNVILVTEGYATAATIFEACNLPVAVAFNANNLTPVSEALKKAYPHVQIIVCADDDYLTPGNPGVYNAELAANAVNGKVIIPNFSDTVGNDIRGGEKLTDFNDLYMHGQGGLHLVRAQIEAELTKLDIKVSALPPKAETDIRGGGRKKAVSTLPLDDLVERFIFIDEATGDYVYDSWTKEVVKFTKVVKMLTYKMRTEDIKQHPTWVSRAIYLDQIGFDPTEKDSNILCNTWNGWPSKPNRKAGFEDCERLINLLKYLCSSDSNADGLFEWVLKWMAYPVQNPGAKMQTAVVMHGPQGTGKSLFWESYSKIYGEYGLVINQGAMEDKFNSDWTDKKLFILADEIVARSEVHHMKNMLKSMITGETIRVNPKNMIARTEKNHMNLVFLSNEHLPVVIEEDDRRHAVVYTPTKLHETSYEEIQEELLNGGVEALHNFLLHVDLEEFHPWTKPPMTDAKQNLIDLNLETPQAFIKEYLDGDLDLPVGPVKNSQLYSAYQKWCRANGEKYPRTAKQFLPVLKSAGWFVGHKRAFDSYHYTNLKRCRVIIPSDRAFLTAQENGAEVILRKNNQTEQEWVTDGIMSFSNKDSVVERDGGQSAY